jgi:spore germination protein YaaH
MAGAALVAVALVATVLFAGIGRAPSGATDAGVAGVAGSGSGDSLQNPSIHPVPGHEVYGFVPYWEMDDSIAAHVDRLDLTTIALFSVTHRSNGSLATSASGYQRIIGPIGRRIVSDAHDRARRVDITYTSFGRSKNAALFASQRVQDVVIAGLVGLRATLDADGIAVDVEDIDPADIPAYGSFVGRLRAALLADHAASTVTATTSAGPQGVALAAAAKAANVDRIFLMAYDYRTGSGEPGGLAPLARTDGGVRTITWSLDLYSLAGIPSSRLILGLPLYGLSWPVGSSDLGAPASGAGTVWVPRQHLDALASAVAAPVVDPIEQVAFVAAPRGAAWTAIYYDTPGTLAAKLVAADARGLAGGGLWAVGYDRGLPGYAATIADFRAGRLTAPSLPDAASSALPSIAPSTSAGR